MSYYVSIVDGSKSVLALGPFNRHGDALRSVSAVREHVSATYRDSHWFG